MHQSITRELSEIIEAHSGAAFHRSAPVEYAAKLGIEATNIGSATLLSAQKSNNLYFNRVVGLGLASHATLGLIEQILDYYAERKIDVLPNLKGLGFLNAIQAELTAKDWDS